MQTQELRKNHPSLFIKNFMDDLKKYKINVASPCCMGALIGTHFFYGYKIFGCMGCGKVIERKIAIEQIIKTRNMARERVNELLHEISK